MPSFTDIKKVVNFVLAALKELLEKLSAMFDGIHYEMKGYPEETTAE